MPHAALPDGRHFTAAEFACHDGAPYPVLWLPRWLVLRDLCDEARDIAECPVSVVSGYRSDAHNQALIAADEARGSHGVASGSEHTNGNAADLRPFDGDVEGFHRKLLEAHAAGRLKALGGIAVYPISRWVHIDTAKAADGHLRRWPGR